MDNNTIIAILAVAIPVLSAVFVAWINMNKKQEAQDNKIQTAEKTIEKLEADMESLKKKMYENREADNRFVNRELVELSGSFAEHTSQSNRFSAVASEQINNMKVRVDGIEKRFITDLESIKHNVDNMKMNIAKLEAKN